MIGSAFERFVAFRYLRSKRKEVFISIITVISVLGVAISVMVLDVVLAVMTGFESELRDKLIGANAHVVVRKFGGQLESWQSVREKVLTVPGVTGAFPYTYNQAMLTVPSGARGLLIHGISDLPEAKKKVSQYLEEGTDIEQLFTHPTIEVMRPDGIPDQVRLPPLVVGRELRKRLGIPFDEPVTMFSPELSSSPQGLIPKQRRFIVVGSYSSGLVEYENSLAYTSMADAQAFFGLGEGVTGVEVTVKNLFEAKQTAQKILEALGGPESNFYTTDWTEPNKPLWDAIRLEKRVYFIVLLLLILVASFSIVSTLVMVVMEKGKDIAILKSMGARDSSILRIFLIQGSVIGVAGTILGTALGVAGCWGLREFGFEIDRNVFSLDRVPVHMIPSNFITVACSAFVITTLAGIYPAVRASRLKPAEALRYE